MSELQERCVFTSCMNKGFQIRFAGGLVASVQWGVGNYTDKYNTREGDNMRSSMLEDAWGRNLCEIGCFVDGEKTDRGLLVWVEVPGFTSNIEDVRGYCDAPLVVGFLSAVLALDKHRSPEAYENYPEWTGDTTKEGIFMTPAGQEFNHWMSSQKATQADGKPKVDESYLLDEKLGYLPIPCDDDDDDEYEREMEEKEMEQQELEDQILMDPDIFPINRRRYRIVDDYIESVFEDFDNCSYKGKQTVEAQHTLSDYIEMLESKVRKFKERMMEDE